MYTWLLRAMLDVSWKQHASNKALQGNLSKIKMQSVKGKYDLEVIAGEVNKKLNISFYYGIQIIGKDP